jgi:HD-GYP domain-containing protein (c-di-GMP phosphodiesterase class II)
VYPNVQPNPFLTPVIERPLGIFHPAPLATLRPNSGAHFELYLAVPTRAGVQYLLYKAAEIEFTDKKRLELMENGVTTLYVSDQDAGVYYEFVDRTVGEVLRSATVPPQEKSRVLYETSSSLIKSTFERPESPLVMSTNQRVVTHTVSAISAEPAMLRTLVSMFTFDYSLYSHSVHVSVLGSGLLLEMGDATETEVRDLAMGLLLHDIGKCRVPPDIIRKPGLLSPWEIKQIERHPEHGVGLMQHHEVIRPQAIEVIRDHHELLDGSGYPHHLSGKNIPVETRICSAADVFDALTSHRPYKPAMTGYDALRLMLDRMSSKLDDEILHLLIHRLGPNARRPV